MSNQLKRDPTRTTMLRRRFMADMTRRFRKLSKAIQILIVDDDAFGLEGPAILQVKQVWRFRTDAQKIQSYRKWLQQQVDAGILSPVGGISGKPWTAPYIESAYKKGGLRAYTDLRAEELANHPSLFEGGQAEFIRTAFSQPEALHKIELLYERAFDELKGVTDVMGQQMSRTLAEGLAQGYGPAKIARALHMNVSNITKTRANVIARTEIIRAHAEGQLDAFERLGVEEVGVMAEWSTAGDERVCIECGELEGVVMTVKEAKGLLPRHPNCRCAWIPANKARREKGQLWGKDKDRAIEKSIQAEAPIIIKRTAAEVRRRSVWPGKEVVVKKKLPKIIRELIIEEKKALSKLLASDIATINAYKPPPMGIRIYNKVMRLETTEARGMMSFRGVTKGRIYKDILKNRNLQIKTVSTKTKYFGKKASKSVIAKREKIHNRIIRQILGTVKSTRKPQILMTGGYPGSGKSSMLNVAFPGWKKKYIHIDSDIIKLRLAKIDGFTKLGWRSSVYQQEADMIIKQVMRKARMQNKNILFDGTMKSSKKMIKMVEDFNRAGYNTRISFADLPLEKSMLRSISRMYGKEDRFVDLLYQASHGTRNIGTFNKLKPKVNEWFHYDTDVARGVNPILIDKGM